MQSSGSSGGQCNVGVTISELRVTKVPKEKLLKKYLGGEPKFHLSIKLDSKKRRTASITTDRETVGLISWDSTANEVCMSAPDQFSMIRVRLYVKHRFRRKALLGTLEKALNDPSLLDDAPNVLETNGGEELPTKILFALKIKTQNHHSPRQDIPIPPLMNPIPPTNAVPDAATTTPSLTNVAPPKSDNSKEKGLPDNNPGIKQEQREVAEAERLRQEKEDADRQAETIKVKKEQDKIAKQAAEEKATNEKEKQDKISKQAAEEKATKEKEKQDRKAKEAEKAAAAAAPALPTFGNDPSSGFPLGWPSPPPPLTPPDKPWVEKTGGGDDGPNWASSGAKPIPKKGAGRESPSGSTTTANLSASSSGSSWGTTGSASHGGFNDPGKAASPRPSPKPEAAEPPSTVDRQGFSTSAPNPGPDSKPSPQAPSLEPQGERHAAEGAEGAAEEDGSFNAAGGGRRRRRKKNRKGKNNSTAPAKEDTPQEEAMGTSIVPEAEPEQAAPAARGARGEKGGKK